MGQKFALAFLACALLNLCAGQTAAWHDRGHMTVALIAFRQLDEDQKDALSKILAKHPHYRDYLSAEQPDGAPLDEWVFMRAAVWPDWVRSHAQEYSHPTHHYADAPVARWEGLSQAQRKQMEKNIAALSNTPNGELLQRLPEYADHLGESDTEAKERAIALCWVLHLVGDIHQPLHAASLFTKDSLEGDRGGNVAYVPWHRRPEKLHSIWDGILGWDEFNGLTLSEFGVIDLMTRSFLGTHSIGVDELSVTSIDAWAKESHDLAEHDAYAFDGTPIEIVLNFDHHPHLNARNMDPLPTGYVDRGQAVAERRVALGGRRLAIMLKDRLP